MVLDRAKVLDRVFQALSHPARRSMLRQLAAGERNLTELAAPFKMSFPAASKHVRVLERANLVRRRIEGREHMCRLQTRPLRSAAAWIDDYRKLWEQRLDQLDDVLNELQKQENANDKRK